MNQNFLDCWVGDILSEENLSAELSDQAYWHLLDDQEQKKATRYARPDLQKQYVKTRGALRTILASYLNLDAQALVFELGEYGKPYLAGNPVFFNLSHTKNTFVAAVSNDEIGVDIEQIKQRQGFSGLVDKCFSEIEKKFWYNLPELEKTKMFYHFWVRKEAFVKAVGRGIALGLEECVVNPEKTNQFSAIPRVYGCALDWKIHDINMKEMQCAIVTKNRDYNVKQFNF